MLWWRRFPLPCARRHDRRMVLCTAANGGYPGKMRNSEGGYAICVMRFPQRTPGSQAQLKSARAWASGVLARGRAGPRQNEEQPLTWILFPAISPDRRLPPHTSLRCVRFADAASQGGLLLCTIGTCPCLVGIVNSLLHLVSSLRPTQRRRTHSHHHGLNPHFSIASTWRTGQQRHKGQQGGCRNPATHDAH